MRPKDVSQAVKWHFLRRSLARSPPNDFHVAGNDNERSKHVLRTEAIDAHVNHFRLICLGVDERNRELMEEVKERMKEKDADYFISQTELGVGKEYDGI